MKKLNTIKIAGKLYPVIVDLNVLSGVQDVYGSVSEFERELLGVKFKKDKNGAQVYTKEGDPDIELVEPSIKAITTILPLMINEGLELEARRKGEVFEPLEELDIISKVDIYFIDLAKMIHDEYKKCFETKKS